MTKRKRKKSPQAPASGLAALNDLFKEAMTMAESRQRRTRKTSHSLLNMKRRVHSEHEKILVGSLTRHHIQAHVQIITCSKCGDIYKHVDFLHVWSHSPVKSNSSQRMTTEILSKGMYELHRDLPIHIVETKCFVPICVECLYIDAGGDWAETEEERVAAL